MNKFLLKYSVIMLLMFFLVSNLAAQSGKIDTLIMQLTTAADTAKVKILNKLCWELRNSEPNKAIQYGEEAIRIAKEHNNTKDLLTAYSFTGVAYRNLGNYSQALSLYFIALKLAEQLNDKESQGYALINIGNAYYYQDNVKQGIPYLDKATKVANEIGNKGMEAYAYLNLGRSHAQLNDYQNALRELEMAYQIRNQLNKEPEAAVCLQEIGDVYLAQKKHGNARQHYMQALEIVLKYKDDLDLMAEIYNQLAVVDKELKNYAKAEEYAQQSLTIAMKVGNKYRINLAYFSLADIFAATGRFEKAFNHHRLATMYKDSVFNDEKNKQITELQTIYETQKKEQENEKLKVQNELNKLQLQQKQTELNKQQNYLSGILVGAIILLLFSIAVYSQYNAKKKANLELAEKNGKIENQKQEIEAQHDKMQDQKTKLTDSIQYASRIQRAILPPDRILSMVLKNYFVFFKPRDIVSGDFYWIRKVQHSTDAHKLAVINNDRVILAAADCTGHGVPGAFMSILGISFLNEIVSQHADKITTGQYNAGDILDQMRSMMMESLHQTGAQGESMDGLDIAIAVVDNKNLTIDFAGANNPLFIVRKLADTPKIGTTYTELRENSPQINVPFLAQNFADNYQIIHIPGSKMPIGIHKKSHIPFKNNHLNLESEDTIYLTTDGYIDQFGGGEGRKFLTSRLKQLILLIQDKPLVEQKNILDRVIEAWRLAPKHTMMPNDQIDDMLVIGYKINPNTD